MKLKEWILLQENQIGKRLKKLRSDNGGEYVNNVMGAWLKDHGIDHQKNPQESPQGNGVAERMNRTLQDRVRSMLHGSGLRGGGLGIGNRNIIVHQKQRKCHWHEQDT